MKSKWLILLPTEQFELTLDGWNEMAQEELALGIEAQFYVVELKERRTHRKCDDKYFDKLKEKQ